MSTLIPITQAVHNAHYDFETPTGKRDLKISNMCVDGHPEEFRFHANLASDRVIFNEEWKSHALPVTFDDEEAAAIRHFEERLWNPVEHLVPEDEQADWDIVPFFKSDDSSDYFLKLKVEKSGKKFKTTTNLSTLVPLKECKDLYIGQSVTLRGMLFFYYNLQQKRAGLSLKIPEMHFKIRPRLMEAESGDDEVVPVEKPSLKRKQRTPQPSPGPPSAAPTVRKHANGATITLRKQPLK